MQRSPENVDGMMYALETARHIHTQNNPQKPYSTTASDTPHHRTPQIYQCSIDNMPYGSDDNMRQQSNDDIQQGNDDDMQQGNDDDMRQRSVDIMQQ
jgi:hypothetical protein